MTVLCVMGTPFTGGRLEHMTGSVCVKACVRSTDEHIGFTFYPVIFSGTYAVRYVSNRRRGYW